MKGRCDRKEGDFECDGEGYYCEMDDQDYESENWQCTHWVSLVLSTDSSKEVTKQ